MEEDNIKKSNSKMQLIIIEPNENLEYYDISKIGFHKFDDELCVVPTENQKEYIPIIFKRYFIHQNAFQRIICIDECESDPKRYLLIFATPEKCIRFIESIKNNKKVKDKLFINASSDDEIFKMKYLEPIVKIARDNSLLEKLLKSVLSEILQYYQPSSKTETNILQSENSAKESSNSQNQSQNDNVNISTETSKVNQSNVESERRKSLRKQPVNISYQDVEKEESNGRKTLKRKYPTKMVHQQSESKLLEKIIHAPNFSVINYVRNGITKSRLFIFSNSDKSECYEFYHRESKNQYICSGCYSLKKKILASIEINSNGNEYVKCHRIDHICELRKFDPEKFQSDLIIKKPNYQLIEEERKGRIVKSLLLFTSKNMKKFYKLLYINRAHSYLCTKCDTFSYKGTRKYITANIGYDKDGEEFIYVRNIKHVCSKMEYLEAEEATIMDLSSTTLEPPKNNQMLKNFKHQKTIKKHEENEDSTDAFPGTPQTPQNIDESKIIRKPYFQLFQRKFQGKICQKLAVFDSNDLTMCHELTWSNRHQYYICHPCKNYFGKSVFAKIIKNENEEEYVQMGITDHHCKLQKFQL